ncbi:hypothetical protein SAMN06265348_104383 [Pedobacter westerhofensis]|uniref:MetA-pathway of phenol degradation n=1 Tax=Pedobacter westerhofensis TaxID=425512 RepID=A0A521D024_9SPHI|nr:hypothetical protein [Pedobacter westerhofensis]SMO65046.1 hypothetical protein SAMN06265348_104383 [Pedobacter westerhofensis]
MKINILIVGMLLFSIGTYAQNMFSMSSIHPADTLKKESREQAIRFNTLRRASVTADIFGSGHFDSKLNDEDLNSGKSRNSRISSFFSIPISSWDGNVIGATIYHNEQFFDVREVDNKLAGPLVNTGSTSKSTLGLALNYSRTDELFHTPVIYSAVFTGISDNLKSVRRFNFNGSIVFPVRKTPDVYFAVGALVQIDPSAPTPVLPTINYYRKLNSNGLDLIVDLPQSATLKQSLSRKAWVYLGSNANTYASFYKSGAPALPHEYSYNTIEIKSGPGFEYLLGKYILLGISGGVNSTVSARTIAKDSNYDDAFIKTKGKSTTYGEFRISLLPF